MYNPQHMHVCEKIKTSHAQKTVIDYLMTFVGVIASLSSIPQVIKIWQTQDVSGISLMTQILALVSVIAWFLYALYIRNMPLGITSAITTVVLSTVVIQILLTHRMYSKYCTNTK